MIGLLIASATAIVAPLAIPAVSSGAEALAVSSGADDGRQSQVQKPSQEQWKELDKVAKSHSALGVFGVDSDSDPVLMLPAGTPAGEKTKALAGIPAGMKVTVKTSKFTKNEVDKIQAAVGEAKWHKDAKKYGLGSFYDGEQDKVMVNTDAPASVTASLKSSYGDKIEVLQSRFEQQVDRYHEQQPFYGGSSVHTDRWGNCTSGWALWMTNPETGQHANFLTSAGHCYTLNELVKSADGDWMGWVKRFGEIDALGFVGYQYDNSIWTGGSYGSTSNMETISTSGLWTGMQVCVSGQTTYNHCGHPVTSTAYGFNWTDHNGHSHWTNSAYGFAYGRGGSNNNGPITQSGDSGAPVHKPYNTDQTTATGTHSGVVSWYNGPCSCTEYRMFGVKMQGMYDSWGASLLTP